MKDISQYAQAEAYTLIKNAMSFVVALAWRDAIKRSLEIWVKQRLVPEPGEPENVFNKYPYLPYYIYAIILTTLVISFTFYVSKKM